MRSLWPKAALAAASLVVLAAAPAQYLGRQQDDLLYLVSAQALLQGHYRLFTAVGAPPLTMITPGFPLLLAPVTALFGERHAAHQAFCALVLAGLPWAWWLWLKRRLPEGDAALVAAAAALSPLCLSQAGAVMSEPFYAALAVAFLLAIEERRLRRAGWLWLALTQVRPAGLSLLPALLAGARGWRERARLLLPGAAAALLWSLWSWSVSGEVQELQELRQSYAGQGWLHPARVMLDNLRFYLEAWGGCYLPAPLWAAAPFLGAALMAAAAYGCRLAWKRPQSRPAVLMLAGAAAMHAVWAWQYERYLLPVLPWLLWAVAEAAGKRATLLLCVLLALQGASHSWRWALRPSPFAEPELGRTYAWLRSSTEPEEAVASAVPVRDGFYAVRPASPLPDEERPEVFARRLKARGVRWVLWQERLEVGLSTGKSAAIQGRLDRARANLEAGPFRAAFEDRKEGTRVYELR